GSSAMPHKMNTRSCERINGLAVVLRGYASMAGELAGQQWNEGDVSDSVVRRVALPDTVFAADGPLETVLTVLAGFGPLPAAVARPCSSSRAVPLAGQQRNEAAVSDSVVRRVALPDTFFAADGLLETFLTVLAAFGAFPAVVARELNRYLPFLATTKVLMAAV